MYLKNKTQASKVRKSLETQEIKIECICNIILLYFIMSCRRIHKIHGIKNMDSIILYADAEDI